MCPKDSEFVLITDKSSVAQAKDILNGFAPGLKAIIFDVDQIMPGADLTVRTSFNGMLKQPEFWRQMPHEQLLIIQTDALLAKPLNPFFFNFSYLGAPFLPRQHSEYFTKRTIEGHISRFFKTDSPIHGSPDPDVYPHLHGNGGLSSDRKQQWRRSASTGENRRSRSRRRLLQPSHKQGQHTSSTGNSSSIFHRNDIQPQRHWHHACWKF